jgi:hypothetical protein
MARLARDGRTWPLGTDVEVAWIVNGTSIGQTITAAIPPVFEAYATVVLPEGGEGQDQHDQAVLGLLREQSAGQPWWLGYLDTGADDIVFPDAPRVTLYTGWHYVLVQAGPEQAATWRESGPWSFWKGALPNLMFPADRSWLVSTLWDDDWTCIGGPAELVDRLLRILICRPGRCLSARTPRHQAVRLSNPGLQISRSVPRVPASAPESVSAGQNPAGCPA